ncbi:MAG: hypothetical protein Q8Q25_01555 [bacterium]|nr:hypothetical protein [bacterium]
MHKVKKYLPFVLVISSIWYVDAGRADTGPFVVKKKKGPSCSVLTEQCCQEVGDIVRCFPPLLKRVAEVQELDMSYLDQVLNGEKSSVLNSTDKEKLKKILTQLRSFKEYLHEVNGKMKQHISFLESLA